MGRREERSPGNRLVRHAWLLIPAAVALVAVLATTRSGLGASTDSVAYLALARSLHDGRGLQVPTGIYEIYADLDTERDSVAGPHFPPLFPVVLALAGGSNDRTSFGRGLNACLLAATVVTAALMVQRSTGSRRTALFAACFIALSPAILRTHAMLWSEPLFIALGLVGLLALARHLDQGRPSTLVVASVAMGLAWLARYAGIALVLTGLLVLGTSGRRPRGRRVLVFLFISTVPMFAFLTTMALEGSGGGGYTMAPQLPAVSALREGGESLGAWVLPRGTPNLPGIIAALAVVGIVAVALPRGTHTSSLRLILSVFLVVYAGVLLSAIVLFAEHVPLEERMLVPAYVVAVVLVACRVGRVRTGRRLARRTLRFVLAGVIVAIGTAGSVLVVHGAKEGRGFLSRSWALADDLRQISGLPASTRIYTNFPEAVYLTADRPARLLPKRMRTDGRPNPRYAAQLARLADDVRDGRVAVVFFAIEGRPHLPDASALTTALGTAPTAADVVSYQWVTRP